MVQKRGFGLHRQWDQVWTASVERLSTLYHSPEHRGRQTALSAAYAVEPGEGVATQGWRLAEVEQREYEVVQRVGAQKDTVACTLLADAWTKLERALAAAHVELRSEAFVSVQEIAAIGVAGQQQAMVAAEWKTWWVSGDLGEAETAVAERLVDRADMGILVSAADLTVVKVGQRVVVTEPETQNETLVALAVWEGLLDHPVVVHRLSDEEGMIHVAGLALEEGPEGAVDADAAIEVADSMAAKAVLVAVEEIALRLGAFVVEHLAEADKEAPTLASQAWLTEGSAMPGTELLRVSRQMASEDCRVWAA